MTGKVWTFGDDINTDVIAPGGMQSATPRQRALGIACVLAESLNGLFFRNAVNYGFGAFACPGITALLTEGDTARVSTDDWTVTSLVSGKQLPLTPIPAGLLGLMTGGGIFPDLERRGLIKALG
jgi:3-isopropylmalate/(R)-2-methylmalate dehydratase small subunit